MGDAETGRPHGLRVLLVEDSPAVRGQLREALEGFRPVRSVTTAASVAEARDRLAGDEFDVGVLDLRLGDGTALELLAQRRGDTVPPVVAVVTQHPSARIREACLDRGADCFFEKANAIAELKDMLLRARAGRYQRAPFRPDGNDET